MEDPDDEKKHKFFPLKDCNWTLVKWPQIYTELIVNAIITILFINRIKLYASNTDSVMSISYILNTKITEKQ